MPITESWVVATSTALHSPPQPSKTFQHPPQLSRAWSSCYASVAVFVQLAAGPAVHRQRPVVNGHFCSFSTDLGRRSMCPLCTNDEFKMEVFRR